MTSLFHQVLLLRRKVVERYNLFNDIFYNGLWLKLLRENIDDLYVTLKKEFDETLMHLRVKASFPIISRRVSIFSVFEYMFHCTRFCDS